MQCQGKSIIIPGTHRVLYKLIHYKCSVSKSIITWDSQGPMLIHYRVRASQVYHHLGLTGSYTSLYTTSAVSGQVYHHLGLTGSYTSLYTTGAVSGQVYHHLGLTGSYTSLYTTGAVSGQVYHHLGLTGSYTSLYRVVLKQYCVTISIENVLRATSMDSWFKRVYMYMVIFNLHSTQGHICLH